MLSSQLFGRPFRSIRAILPYKAITFLSHLLISMLLLACDGGVNNSARDLGASESEAITPNPPKTVQKKVDTERNLLKVNNDKEFRSEYQRILRDKLSENSYSVALPQVAVLESIAQPTAAPVANAAADMATNTTIGKESDSFSETNTQITGVDELDAMKFDGNYFYQVKQDIRPVEPVPVIQPAPEEELVETTFIGRPSILPYIPIEPIPYHLSINSVNNTDASTEQVSKTTLTKSVYYQGMYQHPASSTLLLLGTRSEYIDLPPIKPQPLPERIPEIETSELEIEPQLGSEINVAEPVPVETLVADSPMRTSFYYPGPSKSWVSVELFDVSDKAEPQKTYKMELEGNLVGSRRIGNKLYLVTSKSALPKNWSTITSKFSDAKEGEKETVVAADLSDIDPELVLPSLMIDGQISPLVNPSDCLVAPNQFTTANYEQLNFTTITTLDITNPESRSSTCLLGSGQLMMTQKNLYLFSVHYISSPVEDARFVPGKNISRIHQFSLTPESLTKGIGYVGSVEVPGGLDWPNPSYRLGEVATNHLAVVSTDSQTTEEGIFEPKHQVFIIADTPEEGSFNLPIVSQLPNANRSVAIGKPGERITSVRFMRDTAYIVTFRNIDPLYVLNLQDPADPFISGEVELSGFSEYLHPLGASHLLGVGREVSSETNRRGGIKISLFAIESGVPSVQSSFTLGSDRTYTPLANDPHAVAILPAEGSGFRLALPVEDYSVGDFRTRSRLDLFEIDPSLVKPIKQAGSLVPTATTQVYNDYRLRTAIAGDAVYFIDGTGLEGRLWPEN